jgi:hypothetical protein
VTLENFVGFDVCIIRRFQKNDLGSSSFRNISELSKRVQMYAHSASLFHSFIELWLLLRGRHWFATIPESAVLAPLSPSVEYGSHSPSATLDLSKTLTLTLTLTLTPTLTLTLTLNYGSNPNPNPKPWLQP